MSAWGACTCSCFAQSAGEELGCAVPPERAPSYFARISAPAETYRSGQERIEERSGVPGLDRALAQSLGMISRMFDVLPGFAYYDDRAAPNAKATSAHTLDRADGTVLFGHSFLRRLLDRPEHRDASVVAMCAHEFGHIIAYNRGLVDELAPDRTQPYRAEQFADFIAGYFAGRRKLERPDYPAVAFATTMRDYGEPNRGTHGTPDERGRAVERGFLAAYQRQLDVDEAVRNGFQFAMSQT